MAEQPQLIVGLGNPGPEHERDRHNVGYWLIEDLAAGSRFNADQKLLGDICQVSIQHHNVRLLKPTTFMNRSGQSLRQTIDYFKVPIERVLVIHDELDLPPGTARLKRGGTETLRADFSGNGYGHEAQHLMQAVAAGRTQSGIMPLAQSVEILKVVDAAMAQIGRRP